MRSTAIDRRRFLRLLAVAAGSPLGVPGAPTLASGQDAPAANTANRPAGPNPASPATAASSPASNAAHLYLAARRNGDAFQAVAFDSSGNEHLVLPLRARGHSFAMDAPRGRAVMFGRQPGFYALAFSLTEKQDAETIRPAHERHFFGHGVFSDDGELLAATENDYQAGRGVIGIYDARPGAGFRRVTEFPSGGTGPHEVILMPDGRTLCVANGGILTHPDYGKQILNAHDMRPSLDYIDMHTGNILEHHELDPALNRLSIRHLTLDGSGAVWFGCQHKGPAQERPPLVGRHRRGSTPQLFAGPQAILHQLRNYIGSIACDASGTRVITSSPAGGIVAVWDAETGACLGSSPIFDGCGVAPLDERGFLLTSGQGEIAALPRPGATPRMVTKATRIAWDNHLRRVRAGSAKAL